MERNGASFHTKKIRNGANTIRCKVLNHKILVSVANHEYIYYGYLLKKTLLL